MQSIIGPIRRSQAQPQRNAPTVAELERVRPFKPELCADGFSADRERTRAELRNAGPRGRTTIELMQAGCGPRPANRVCELRKLGCLIQTKREGRGQFRFVLVRNSDGDAPMPSQAGPAVDSRDLYARPATNHGRRPTNDADLPLFAAITVRRP